MYGRQYDKIGMAAHYLCSTPSRSVAGELTLLVVGTRTSQLCAAASRDHAIFGMLYFTQCLNRRFDAVARDAGHKVRGKPLHTHIMASYMGVQVRSSIHSS